MSLRQLSWLSRTFYVGDHLGIQSTHCHRKQQCSLWKDATEEDIGSCFLKYHNHIKIWMLAMVKIVHSTPAASYTGWRIMTVHFEVCDSRCPQLAWNRMLKLGVTTLSLLKAFCRFITSFPTKPSSATIFVGAINTLILKLIICSVCTCTTGKGISVRLLGFTYFSISRWGGVFLVCWL